MIHLLLKVLPLDLATLLSPGIFAVALVVLGSKHHPRAHTFALFIGSLLVGVIATFCGFVLGLKSPDTNPSHLTSIVDIVLGVIFLVFALATLLSKPSKNRFQEAGDSGYKILKWIAIGFAITATNLDAVFLSFAAAKEVNGAPIQYIEKLITLIVNLFFFTLPITLPLVVSLIIPRTATIVLGHVNRFIAKYAKYLLFVLFLIFGIYLLIRGLGN